MSRCTSASPRQAIGSERSREEHSVALLEDLRWLGLEWDAGPDREDERGPYRQSQRSTIYLSFVRELMRQGRAYPDFATKDELAEKTGAEGFAVGFMSGLRRSYGDGPVYVRVNKAQAGPVWARRGYDVRLGEPCSVDTGDDYVPCHDSHSAYVYTRWLRQEGVPASALTVVRLERRSGP